MAESILLVRHGRGRGRLWGYWNAALRYLDRHHAGLYDRVRLHYTGDAPPDLDDVAAAVFWLGDPLEERYPECFAEAADIASRCPTVVNRPAALSHTIKSRQASLWREAGVPTPPTRPFGTRAELDEILEGVRYPVLIRPDHLHAASSLHVCRSREEALALPPEDIDYPGTVTRFVDTRRGYRSVVPDSLWAEFYHKKRAFVFGDTVVPGHLFFSREPVVRAATSTLAFHRRMRDRARDLLGRLPRRLDRRLGLSVKLQRTVPLGRDVRRSLRRELDFATSAPEAPDRMRKAARALDLDFVALDYSVLADGRILFWEANPYPYMARWEHAILPTRRRLETRNARVFEAVADHFRTLLGESPG